MLVYLREGSVQTTVRAATLREKLQTKLSTSPSQSIQTPGQPSQADRTQVRRSRGGRLDNQANEGVNGGEGTTTALTTVDVPGR